MERSEKIKLNTFSGNVYGYNRVSTKQQHEDRGNIAIEEFCKRYEYPLVRIYVDKQTGKNFDRARYRVLKEDVLRPGDILVIPEYDRLGRADETKAELEYFRQHGIRVIFIDIPTTHINFALIEDPLTKLSLNCVNDTLISVFDFLARTELERKKKRQKEGYDALRARGEWDKLGRPREMSIEEFALHYQAVENNQMKPFELMKKLNMKQSTYYKYRKEIIEKKYCR